MIINKNTITDQVKQLVGELKSVLYRNKLDQYFDVKIATIHAGELPTITILPKTK